MTLAPKISQEKRNSWKRFVFGYLIYRCGNFGYSDSLLRQKFSPKGYVKSTVTVPKISARKSTKLTGGKLKASVVVFLTCY